MRKILIVGAGQSGLQLALSLLDHDYDVTVLSARAPDEIRAGRVMSTQCMFDAALQHERDHRLNLWEQEAVKVEGLDLSVAGPDGTRALNWTTRLDHYAQSVDQRIKMAAWLELVGSRGGKTTFSRATISELDAMAAHYDLVVAATGRGELGQLFERDSARSPYANPQRVLSLAYVHGLAPRPEHPDTTAVSISLVPGVGELFVIPGYTFSGNCDMLFFEGIPGGPLDCWTDRPGPAEHVRRMLDLIRRYVPWEFERSGRIELTDPLATLTGAVPPVVRHPVGQLPSGRFVLGMADAVVTNDPITGQGSNCASISAAAYVDSMLERGHKPFDRQWMQRTFDAYWAYAQLATEWTNAMLQPPPQHVIDILTAAATNPTIAARFANGFNDPTDFQYWFLDPHKAADYLASFSA